MQDTMQLGTRDYYEIMTPDLQSTRKVQTQTCISVAWTVPLDSHWWVHRQLLYMQLPLESDGIRGTSAGHSRLYITGPWPLPKEVFSPSPDFRCVL